MAACDAGRPTQQVATLFNVSPAWVRRLKQHRRERGDIVPRNGGGSRGRKIDRTRLADGSWLYARSRTSAQGAVSSADLSTVDRFQIRADVSGVALSGDQLADLVDSGIWFEQ